jgi:O-antigen/teichoic acid export membrane protein
MRFYPQFANAEGRHSFINFILLLSVLGFGIFLLTFCIFENSILSFFQSKAGEIMGYTHLILWLTFLLLAITLLEYYSRAMLKVAVPAFLREIFIRLLQAVLVCLYFIKIISFQQFLVLSVALYVLCLLILIIYLRLNGSLKMDFNFTFISKQKAKEIIQYSTLSFIGTGSMILIAKMDSLMVAAMLGLSANAIYTTAFYMATVIEIPKRAITQTAATIISRAFEKNDLAEVKSIYQKTAINQFIIGALLLIGVWANLHNIFEIMPKGKIYEAGAYVVLIVGLGKLIDMFFGPSSEIIVLSKYYWFNIILITLLAGIGIIANFLLIPVLGVVGAAYGTAAALIVFNLTKYIFIYYKLHIQPFNVATIKVIIISTMVAGVNLMLPDVSNVFLDVIYRSSIITVLFCGLIIVSHASLEVNKVYEVVLRRLGLRQKV